MVQPFFDFPCNDIRAPVVSFCDFTNRAYCYVLVCIWCDMVELCSKNSQSEEEYAGGRVTDEQNSCFIYILIILACLLAPDRQKQVRRCGKGRKQICQRLVVQ